MNRRFSQLVLVALATVNACPLQAREPIQNARNEIMTKDVSDLSIAAEPEKLQAMMGEHVDESSTVLKAIAQFLQLRPNQIEALVGLLQSRRSALVPLLQGLEEREKQLTQLLESAGPPPNIGLLVIQIHSLQKQVMLVQHRFLTNWQNSLDPEQGQRLEAVRMAAQLQPILSAFHQLALL